MKWFKSKIRHFSTDNTVQYDILTSMAGTHTSTFKQGRCVYGSVAWSDAKRAPPPPPRLEYSCHAAPLQVNVRYWRWTHRSAAVALAARQQTRRAAWQNVDLRPLSEFFSLSRYVRCLQPDKLLIDNSRSELDMDWIHPWIGLGGMTVSRFLIINHCSTASAVFFKLWLFINL